MLDKKLVSFASLLGEFTNFYIHATIKQDFLKHSIRSKISCSVLFFGLTTLVFIQYFGSAIIFPLHLHFLAFPERLSLVSRLVIIHSHPFSLHQCTVFFYCSSFGNVFLVYDSSPRHLFIHMLSFQQ